MANLQEIRVPDIGDFKDVPIVDIYVKSGDTVDLDAPLASIESDKATMDIPSPASGVIKSIAVKAGDKVSMGSLLATIEPVSAAKAIASSSLPRPDTAPSAALAPAPLSRVSTPEDAWDFVVIGGGPGGYSAAFRAADLGLKVALIERDATLGGVCLNVGCIPSKALLHVAAVKEEAIRLAAHGISFNNPKIDLEKLRSFKSSVVGKLTGGLAQMASARKVTIIRGSANFASAHALSVALATGGEEHIEFKQCVIAAGSSPIALSFLPKDPRIVDSTGALELPYVPKRMLVVGGGIIGLEMATVYSALGARIDVVEVADDILAGIDRDLVKIWLTRNKHRFDRILTETKLTAVTADKSGLHASFDGKDAAPATYDLILQSAGRRPNGALLNIEAAGLSHNSGFIPVDMQMRTLAPHILAIGDIVGQPMLAHKAVHQGHVAAEVAAGHKAGFDAHVIPSVAYTDPEIAWVGMTEAEAQEKNISVSVGRFPWGASGRAIANGADYGLTKLIFSEETGRILGGAIVGPSAGDIVGEICLAIEMGADAADIGKTIHPHPTLGESVGLAAESFLGICTDLPPSRKKK